MIFNIRGTHGSGKSTLARRVMDLYEFRAPKIVTGRSRPIGYDCESRTYRRLFVPGSYETPTGGCDTISEITTTYELVDAYATAGHVVLFEGILAQHSGGRLIALRDKHDVTVIALTTSLEICVESVLDRRAARGQFGDFNPRNVNREHKTVSGSVKKLRQLGVTVLEETRETAYEYLRQRLRTSREETSSEEDQQETLA